MVRSPDGPSCPPGWLCASFNNVEHVCQKCGATVEDGRPFCPQCRAPQIHVHVEASEAGAGENFRPVDGFPPESVAETVEWSPGRPYESGNTMDRGIARRAALKAGALGIFIEMIPLLGIVLTGALAVYFYRRESRLPLPAVLAARLGAAAGIVTFGISALLLVVRIFVFHGQQKFVDSLTLAAQQGAQMAGVNTADPAYQATLHFMFSPPGLALIFFCGMIFTVALASAGGALASLLQRRDSTRH